jgi:integrator complex subunit 11
VRYLSFSAHADAKGIMSLIQQCAPAHVMLVHGEHQKMEFLSKKVGNSPFASFSAIGFGVF